MQSYNRILDNKLVLTIIMCLTGCLSAVVLSTIKYYIAELISGITVGGGGSSLIVGRAGATGVFILSCTIFPLLLFLIKAQKLRYCMVVAGLLFAWYFFDSYYPYKSSVFIFAYLISLFVFYLIIRRKGSKYFH